MIRIVVHDPEGTHIHTKQGVQVTHVSNPLWCVCSEFFQLLRMSARVRVAYPGKTRVILYTGRILSLFENEIKPNMNGRASCKTMSMVMSLQVSLHKYNLISQYRITSDSAFVCHLQCICSHPPVEARTGVFCKMQSRKVSGWRNFSMFMISEIQ